MSIELWAFVIWLFGIGIGIFLVGRFDLDGVYIVLALLWPLVLPLLAVIAPFLGLYYLGAYLHDRGKGE